MRSIVVSATLVFSVLLLAGFVCAGQQNDPSSNRLSSQGATKNQVQSQNGSEDGEHLFQVHCGRCHHAPEQIPPRIAGTVLRHMREKAVLTPEDERALMKYLAP
jgi:cytochrome c5